MKERVAGVVAVCAAVVVGSSQRVMAQGLSSPVCKITAGGPGAQDACQQAYDVFQLLAPQLGLALTGGNATAGLGGVLGGLGHFSIGLRGNVFDGLIPDTKGDGYPVSTTGAQRQTLATQSQVFGLPTADAAIGLYKGYPLSLTNIGGVDLLLSGEYVPTINSTSGFSLTPSSNLKLGFGARIGLLSESVAFPAVSFTWVQRDLPRISIGVNSPGGGSTIGIDSLTVRTRAWRIVASKSLIAFGVAAGIGRDNYTQSAVLKAAVTTNGPSESIDAPQDLARTNVFGDISINLPILKIVFEAGDALGGTVQTYNSFSGGRADRSQVYASLGLRLSR
jgi:hypothetical protein